MNHAMEKTMPMRRHLIKVIEGLYPADSAYDSTAAVGRDLRAS
jgi:hypothetical protein